MIQRMFVTLDTKKTNYKNVGKINHGDDLILELTVLSDGDMISFNDPMVDLLVKKSDGKMIRQNSGIEHIKPNKFVIEVSKDCVTSPGLTTNQLVINDNGRISTCMFYYTILNSLEEDIIESISSVEVLEQLDEYVIEAQERMEMLNNDINELEELFGATSDKLVEAEMARNEAEQNRVQSEILRVNNENDRIEADNIRNQNEVDRSSSELVREQRESERILNEEERLQNESERMIDESIRQQNENARQSNESIRMSNETDRKTQENRRVTAETNRANAETTRRNNENSRISNETDRKTQENRRVTAETNRANAETTRRNNENSRISNENSRISNENSRISNETERQKTIKEMKSLIDEAEQNENARQSNESIRMSNETDRKTQENRRVTAEVNRVNEETTRRNNENSRISNETERQKTIEEMKRLIDEANGFHDVYDSKIDFFGKEHDKLSTRLNADFDNVHQRINESELLPYEGVSIKADNSYYGFQKDVVIKGRTLQNVIHKDTFKKSTAYHTVSAEHFVLDGEYVKMIANNSFINAWTYKTTLIKPNTVYTMILEIKENTLISDVTNPFVLAGNNQSECFKGVIYINTGDIGVKVFKLETRENLDEVQFLLRSYINESVTEGYITFRYVILEGDHTQTPLEELPFIEGIESVGDKSKNLFYGAFEEGQINSETGEEIDYNGRCRSVQYANIEPNKTYTVSITQNVVSAPWTSIRLYKDNTYIKTVQDSNGNPNFTFESGEANRLRVTANIPYNDVINCQIEEGTQATPYQPYYDGYKISGKSFGKNLFDIRKHNLELDLDGDYICTSCYTDGTPVKYNLKPNTKYKVDFIRGVKKTNFSMSLNGVLINCGAGKGIFTTDNSGEYYIRIGSETYDTRNYKICKNIYLGEFDTFSSYEPYKETNYSYILNEPLWSLPNGVCDTIDLATGVLTRRVKEFVLDGSEPWKIQSINNNENGLVNFKLDFNNLDDSFRRKDGSNNDMCDRFPIGVRIVDEKNESYQFGQQTLFIRKFISSNITTVSDFKQWLQANPTTVYYELENPTTEQLTPQQLKSFDTTTHIISDNKLMPVVSTKISSNVQAIISTLKLENSDLKNNVEVLTVENEELKSVNNVQDEMIDISMMATDEMYSMLEPILENTPMPMAFEREVSKLVYLYVAMVQRGLKTLDEVPTRYREQVRAMIQYN